MKPEVRLPRPQDRRPPQLLAAVAGATMGALLADGWGALLGGVTGWFYGEKPDRPTAERVRIRREERERGPRG